MFFCVRTLCGTFNLFLALSDKCFKLYFTKPILQSVDVWSMGVLLFVLLVGDHPFYHNDKTKMFLKIAAGDYDLTECHLTDEAKVRY